MTSKNEKRLIPEEILKIADEWTKKYIVSIPCLVIIDESPEIIEEPRWHVAPVYPSKAKIFQQREEIKVFLQVLYDLNISGTAVEVGLDQGGTHLIWKQIFDKVVTIEIDINKCVRFLAIEKPDENSVVFCADSADSATADKLKEYVNSIDMLFIDGDHQYSSVLCDYNCYSKLVRPGGVIGFHDTLGRHPSHLGVVKFLQKLENGMIDGKKHKLIQIVIDGTGISYEIVE